MFLLCDDVKQICATQGIHFCVLGDLIHRLTDSDLCCEVKDDVHTLDGFLEGLPVPHIPRYEVGAGIQVPRTAPLDSMHLNLETVKYPDGISSRYQLIDKEGPNEPGAARDQH